jgi:hypothetical protein
MVTTVIYLNVLKKKSDDPSVCNSRGRCISTNNCSCHEGYGDSMCTPMCYNISDNDPNVCNGNGKCISRDNCSCHGEYSGDECEFPSCFGKPSNNKTVCSSNGECIGLNICKCYQNDEKGYWSGENCSICRPDRSGDHCKGDIFCDPDTTCGSRGTCESKRCICDNSTDLGFWKEPFCDKCKDNYYGENCSKYCNPNTTCNSRGFCSSEGDCECYPNVKKNSNNCSECEDEWEGPKCNCNAENNCTSNGECKNGECECYNDEINGHWSGKECNMCDINYYDGECRKFCEASETCHGNGICSGLGECECFKNRINGFWNDSSNCSECTEEFFGSRCLFYASDLNFTNDGDGLTGNLILPENVTFLNCNQIFTEET